MAAASEAMSYIAGVLTILCTLLAMSEQLPLDKYTREKDFLDAFGQWLAQAQATKNIQSRSDPGLSFPAQVSQLQNLALQSVNEVAPFDGEWQEVAGWPSKAPALGQIAGLATNPENNLVLLHRGEHDWQDDTFDEANQYTLDRSSPIKTAPVVTLDKATGEQLSSGGENRFFLPHGLEIDAEGNYWVTDVALHQVFKFGPDLGEPLLTLGEAFVPAEGNDDVGRFCKPSDVAVTSSGDFFVSDGYCNSRIMKYDANGNLIGIFGQGDMWVPHSLALVEDLDLICVADRENKRILCYNAGIHDQSRLGYPDRAYMDEEYIGRVYAIDYSDRDGYLYAVTAPSEGTPGAGFTIDMYEPDETADIIAIWTPNEQEFTMPHDVTVSADDSALYVCELSPDHNLWKFSQTAEELEGEEENTINEESDDTNDDESTEAEQTEQEDDGAEQDENETESVETKQEEIANGKSEKPVGRP